MSIFFQDPGEVRLPPEEVRLKSLRAAPSSSVGRVRIQIELTPFKERPNIDVSIHHPGGEEVARTTVLENMLPRVELTMHIRDFEAGLEYRVKTRVYYQKLPPASVESEDIQLPDPQVVDEREMTIRFP